MNTIVEVLRAPSPAPLPQSLAFDGQFLWMGSIETSRIYAIDPLQWTVKEESQAPGKPWGMTSIGDELRVLCGEPPDDDRFIRRFIPGHGFKSEYRLACPENTGSQLGYDGKNLAISQWYNHKVVTVDDAGKIVRTLVAPRGICGQVFADGAFYLLTTGDEEASDDYYVTRVDPKDGSAKDLARVPFPGRALAFDGQKFWSNHREAHEMVAFTLPV
ncbi:MAG: hypothetical protein GIW97_00870 [Candidatus Eremiobacteraeota bacterium]|nr:hypothetical protein [Candidatus Eremiobacteraeota bacterium]